MRWQVLWSVLGVPSLPFRSRSVDPFGGGRSLNCTVVYRTFAPEPHLPTPLSSFACASLPLPSFSLVTFFQHSTSSISTFHLRQASSLLLYHTPLIPRPLPAASARPLAVSHHSPLPFFLLVWGLFSPLYTSTAALRPALPFDSALLSLYRLLCRLLYGQISS